MILKILTLALVVTAAPRSGAVSLDDFTSGDHRAFAEPILRDEHCASLLTPPQPALATDLARVDRALVRATELVDGWRRSPAGDRFHAAHAHRFARAFDELLKLKVEFDLPPSTAASIERSTNQLRFIIAYRGFVSSDHERERLFQSLRARSLKLIKDATYPEHEVSRFVFELSILRGQEFMAIFKSRSNGQSAVDPRRAYRARRIEVLERRASGFVRMVKE